MRKLVYRASMARIYSEHSDITYVIYSNQALRLYQVLINKGFIINMKNILKKGDGF